MANVRRMAFVDSRYRRTRIQEKRRVTFDVPSVLVEAAKRDDIAEVTSLMSTRAMSAGDKCSALLTCCRNNSLRCAQILLEKGANVSCRDDDNWTPLHIASACGHTNMVELLLKFNADVGAVDIDGNLSVDHAKDDRITRVLLHYMGKHGLSEHGLHALRAQLAISIMVNIKGLAGRGRARINALNENGVTMLHITAACGYYEAAALLLSYGATVDARDRHGLTPLHVAAKFNQLRMARLLLRSGANAKAAPGVPLPSWANEIISDAVSDPLPAIPRFDAVDFDPYSDPQPCSSFWKLSNLSKTDGQREGSFLSRTWQRNNKEPITSQQAASVEDNMIYEDCQECLSNSSLMAASSHPQLVEELYDTAVVQEVLRHKAIREAWPQKPSLPEDDVYDDVKTVMNGGTTNQQSDADEMYDDLQTVMGTSTTKYQQSNVDDVYDDVQTVMASKPPAMVWQASNKSSIEDNDDMMYDDVKTVMNGVRKNHHPTNSWASSNQHSEENEMYDDVQTVSKRNTHQPTESEDVYDDVQTVMNGVHNSASESISSKSTAKEDKRHTYVNVSQDSYSSVEEMIYDDCVATSKPIVPVPYEEVVFRKPKQADRSHYDDYDDIDECTASLSITSDVKISPPSGRKVARRRSRLPTYTSSPSVSQPSKHPGLTKSYSDSSTTVLSPTPPIRRSSSPRPLPCTPSESVVMLHRRDSTPTQPPPPPPHNGKRHSPRNQGSSRSAFPLSPPPPVNTSSSPSSSPVFSRPIPEESLYTDPDQPLTAPIYHKETPTPIAHNGMHTNWKPKSPPKPLPKPKKRTILNK